MKHIAFFIKPILVLTTIGLALLTGCSKDDEVNDYIRIEKCSITPASIYGSNLLPISGLWNPRVWNSWMSRPKFDVYVLQDGVFNSVGRFESVENHITKETEKYTVHINVPIPQNIDVNRDYTIIALDGVTKSQLSNGKISYNVDLKRGDGAYVPAYYVIQGGNGNVSQSYLASACEYLQITNNTTNTIHVKQKGYETNQKWYYTNGSMHITSYLKLEGSGTINGEVISSETQIPPGERASILSRYVATGKKMNNARLVLEIDGREVKTPPASSQVSIINGSYYSIFVIWDGMKLEWGDFPQ